jgi:AraC family transcriptional regulator
MCNFRVGMQGRSMYTTDTTLNRGHTHLDAPTTPSLYLSSAQAGWTGLVAQAFQEPPELESWVVPARSYVTLILFAGGTMHVEQRHADAPWTQFDAFPESLILRPAMDQSYEVRWACASPAPPRTLHLQLGMDLLSRTAEEIGGYDPTHLSVVERLGFQDPLMAQIGFALWRELEHRAPAGRLYAQLAAQLLAAHLLQHYTSAARDLGLPAQEGLTCRQIARVTDYIQAHLSEDLSLDVLAQQASLSPYHFARLFRRATGESPHQYVLRQRLEAAQRLLADQEHLPLVHIARASGFASQSHFTRTFRHYVGLTPTAYRRLF